MEEENKTKKRDIRRVVQFYHRINLTWLILAKAIHSLDYRPTGPLKKSFTLIWQPELLDRSVFQAGLQQSQKGPNAEARHQMGLQLDSDILEVFSNQ